MYLRGRSRHLVQVASTSAYILTIISIVTAPYPQPSFPYTPMPPVLMPDLEAAIQPHSSPWLRRASFADLGSVGEDFLGIPRRPFGHRPHTDPETSDEYTNRYYAAHPSIEDTADPPLWAFPPQRSEEETASTGSWSHRVPLDGKYDRLTELDDIEGRRPAQFSQRLDRYYDKPGRRSLPAETFTSGRQRRDRSSEYERIESQAMSRESSSDTNFPRDRLQHRSCSRIRRAAEWAWRIVKQIPLLLAFFYVLGLLAIENPLGREPKVVRSDLDQECRPLNIYAVIGRTGVGKSSFIDVLGGRDGEGREPKVCHGLQSCTSTLGFYQASLNEKSICVLDSPGFDDDRPDLTDEEIMRRIFFKLSDNYGGDKLIKGLVYMHDISQSRFGGLALRHFALFEKLCGADNFEHVVLVTSKWLKSPTYDEEQQELRREQDLINTYWKNMTARGSQVERFDGSPESARQILGVLQRKPRLVKLQEPTLEPIDHAIVPKRRSRWYSVLYMSPAAWSKLIQLLAMCLLKILLLTLLDVATFAVVHAWYTVNVCKQYARANPKDWVTLSLSVTSSICTLAFIFRMPYLGWLHWRSD